MVPFVVVASSRIRELGSRSNARNATRASANASRADDAQGEMPALGFKGTHDIV